MYGTVTSGNFAMYVQIFEFMLELVWFLHVIDDGRH